MPTVLRVGPYRFYFYSQEGTEPPHIHVERDLNRAKFWLDPIRLQDSGGFRGSELGRIAGLVHGHRDTLLGAWNDFFGA
jgi:hypothetical protein